MNRYFDFDSYEDYLQLYYGGWYNEAYNYEGIHFSHFREKYEESWNTFATQIFNEGNEVAAPTNPYAPTTLAFCEEGKFYYDGVCTEEKVLMIRSSYYLND